MKALQSIRKIVRLDLFIDTMIVLYYLCDHIWENPEYCELYEF